MKFLSAFVLAGLCFFLTVLAENDYSIIVNKDLATEGIDKATISSVFLGKKSSWANGVVTIPVTLKEGAVHEAFLSAILGKTSSQFKAYWNQLVFTGKGTPPASFSSEKEIVEFVAKTKGAIGYVSPGTDVSSVKTTSVKLKSIYSSFTLGGYYDSQNFINFVTSYCHYVCYYAMCSR